MVFKNFRWRSAKRILCSGRNNCSWTWYMGSIINCEKQTKDSLCSTANNGIKKNTMAKSGDVDEIVLTKDGIEVERKSDSNKGHIFYDEDGNGFQCIGYGA